MEAIAILINNKMVEIAKANAKHEGQVDSNDLKEQAGDGRLKRRVNLDGPDGRAGNGRPEMRSTKVPTKRGHSFSVKTVNKAVSREEKFFCHKRRQGRECWHRCQPRQRGSGSSPQDRPEWSSSLGKKTVLVLCAVRNPQDVPGYAGGAASFLPGGATSASGAVSPRRPTGGSQHHPASMALSDACMKGIQNV